MQNDCTTCGTKFEVTDDELKFIERVSPVINGKTYNIPAPEMCFECRLRRRLSHRNERKLYHRKCDKTKKDIISLHHEGKPYVIYDQKEWWKDEWDPLDYGQDFDFNRPFFEQFDELMKKVPRMSLQQENNENSEYTTNVSHLKDCYLLFSSDFNRDCCYGVWIERSKDCFDNFNIDECELAYECVYSNKIYGSSFIYFSSNCHSSAFLLDCKGCKDCFMCAGLRNKQYYILNKEYTKEEYEAKRKEFPLSSYKNLEAAKKLFADIRAKAVNPHMRSHGRITNSSGDLLTDTENCINCYGIVEGKDCLNTYSAFQAKDAVDCNHVHGEFAYMNCECFPTPQHSAFDLNSYAGSDLYYCDMCMNNCQNLFGCVGLKHAEYCIFNKQYTKEEYEEMVPKIIEHMKGTGEWGQFFPESMSPFGYNESEAAQLYPLPKDEALKKGFNWYDEEEEASKASSDELPDDVNDTSEDICEKVFSCKKTGKPYKIIPQELEFHKTIGVALPRVCPDQRHADRLAERNPIKLFDRKCDKCQKDMKTTYSSDRPETVYCEECYLKKIH